MSFFSLCTALAYLVVDYTYRLFPDITAHNAVLWGFFGAMLITTPFYIAFPKNRERLQKNFKKQRDLILGVSALTTIGAYFWFWAMEQSSSGPISLLEKSDVVMVFILGILFLNERINTKEIIGISISAIGLLFIGSLKGEVTLLAVGLMITSRMTYALQSFFIKRNNGTIDGIAFAYLRMVFSTLFLGIVFALSNNISFIPPAAWFLLTCSQLLGVILARIAYFQAHNYLPISKLNLFTVLKPVLIITGAYIVFQDSISIQKAFGAVLIVGGLGFFTIEQFHLRQLEKTGD